ncbi:MAG: glycoside hydrolase family 30 beta sandwich domain-containing protein [Acidobacteriaceae bacterium]
MKARHALLLAALLAAPLAALAQSPAHDVSLYLTTSDRTSLLKLQPPIPFSTTPSTATQTITVDAAKTYQTIDGFGFALTGGSAELLMHMDPAKRAALLQELFTRTGDGIGVSYLRLTIGSSDMNASVYSYDDLPDGQTDVPMAHFSLAPDETTVIPVMKQILAIDPRIKTLASPWSAPLWMKTNDAAQGGVLLPKYFPAYATYFVKYIEGMKAQGIPIDTVTIQNEPLNEKNTPSMLMLSPEQDMFIKDDLGPAFRRAHIHTGIVLYDHNLDHPLYPLSILRDPAAARYVAGSGFHLYGGTVDAMTEVHDAFPNKNIYFTEQSITQRDNDAPMHITQSVARVMIGVTRNWSKNVLLWNLAADPNDGPHTNNGGCGSCSGALTIDGDNVRRNIAFYTVAQLSKFVPPGSVRIASNDLDTLPNVAFRTPDGKKVLVVSNTTDTPQTFEVHSGPHHFTTTLDTGSVGTYVW